MQGVGGKMANNRMYIECQICKASSALYVAKRYMDGYYTEEMPNPSDWFDEHSHFDKGSQDHFKLVYDCAPNYDLHGIEDMVRGKLA
jgi:hypothetical protein